MIPVSIFLPVIFAIQAAQQSDESQLEGLLKALVDVARRVESEEVDIAQVRKENQPEQAMRQIRDLVHRKVELTSRVAEFVQSTDESKAARILALLSLAQASDQRILLLSCSVLEKTTDSDVGMAIVCGHMSAPENGRSESLAQWRQDLVGLLPYVGCSDKYRQLYSEPQIGGLRAIPYVDFASPPKGVDYLPFFRAMVAFLEKKSSAKARYQIELAARIVKALKIQGPDRTRFAMMVKDIYLEGKEGWKTAMEALADRSGVCGPDQLEILGTGLKNLDAGGKTSVLGEVAQNWGHEVFRPPFKDHFEEAIAHIGTGDGTLYSTHASVIGVLIRQSLDDAWAEKLLIKNPSVTVRRKATSVLGWLTDTTDRFEWRRYSGFLEKMLSDPDDRVSGGARQILEKGLARSPAVLDEARAEELRRRLGGGRR